MLFGVGCYSFMHAGLKSLTASYPPLQLATLRAVLALPLIAIWITARNRWREVAHVRWPLQLFCGLFAIVTIAGAIFAVKALPLASVYAISFLAPILIAAAAPQVLGERVCARRWVAVLLGFTGVLFVLRPQVRDAATLSGLAMLVSAVGYAAQVLIMRVLVQTDHVANTVFWSTLIVAFGAGALALPGWTPVHASHWPLLIAVASLAMLGRSATAAALSFAPASVIAPFEYTALVWASILDWSLWETIPDRMMLIGTTVIIVSGAFLMLRERAAGSRAADLQTASTPTVSAPNHTQKYPAQY